MANITNNEREKIGGFGFDALRYWHGKHICDIFDQDCGVWEFLRTKALALSQTHDPVPYTPSIANISLVYCLENKIDSIHLYPRQSNMTNTVLLYMHYLIESTKGNCLIYYITKDKDKFNYDMNKLITESVYIAGDDSISFHHASNAYEPTGRIITSIQPSMDPDRLNQLNYVECPVYVIVDDALYLYTWEHHLSKLQRMKEKGKDITLVCLSTLNNKTDTTMRCEIQRRLIFDTSEVFFNDEIFYKPIFDSVNIENPAIVYTDFKYIHKDKAGDFESRMKSYFGDNVSVLMRELYLQYPQMPINYIGR